MPSSSSHDPAAPAVIAEVRYSLPHMLKELEAERTASAFAMEKLGQTEITKLFKGRKPTRRAKTKK